jgi:malonyl-CoA decarboxylase
VARFHLGNGARVERLNWYGDPSPKGLKQSYGLMVNYLYDLKRLDKHRAQLGAGRNPDIGRHRSAVSLISVSSQLHTNHNRRQQ